MKSISPSKLVAIVVIFLAIVGVLVLFTDSGDRERDSESITVLLPEKLQNANGESVSRDLLDGKLIGFYFSAEWCPPCRAFTPSLVDFRNENKDKFEVVFVSGDGSEEAQKKYMEDYNMDFLALANRSLDGRKLADEFGVRGIPALIIVDSKGNLITKNGRGDVSSNASGALKAWKAMAAK